MGTLLRTLVSRNLKDWDEKLAHAEFTYNRSPSTATGRTPFEVVYGVNPLCPIDLTSLPLDVSTSLDAIEKIKAMKKLHEQVRVKIEKTNEAYKKKANKHRRQASFQPGDLVWVHLRKERFPGKRKSKLSPRAEGPFAVIARVGDNAYKVDLPGEFGGVSATFNVGDLAPFIEDEALADLRANPFQPGEDDANQAKPRTSPPMTRAQAKMLEGSEALMVTQEGIGDAEEDMGAKWSNSGMGGIFVISVISRNE